MNCRQPHELPCDDVLKDVYLYLDSECDREAKLRIKEHLAECHTCLKEFGIEQEVKALVARCCSNEGSPDGLRDRLRAKLESAMRTSPHGPAQSDE
ncbi:MAG: mycothiol system anti-sigma-R factor [Pseudonocardiaceae bacterium]